MNSAILWLMTRIVRIKRRSFMKSFIAINLFGLIITCEELSKEELNHELIHTAQAKELLYIFMINKLYTSWGFHLELTEHLDDAEISNICSQLPLSADYEGEGINGSVLSLYNY